jgi:glyoxylase-like metal-dependent hydrolase (beta-lactamase superfamily II)
MLVDTGFGIGDLKGLCETLTDKPIFVVNTHNHGDHTGGNPQFGKAYIHSMDASALYAAMRGEGRREIPFDETKHYNYVESDIIEPAEYEVETFEDGHVFDLGGGYEIEAFQIPGHSAGGVALLDRKRRALYSGDAIVWTPTFCSGTIRSTENLDYFTIEKFRDGVARLMEHIDEIDIVYPGHSKLGLNKRIIPDMLACCDELLNGDTSIQSYVPGRDMPVHIHGMAKIAFSLDRIRPVR